ncbi:hypothetical protein H4582DRAFT_2078895 [Lactarius indigo]|nr:hypothetical protein H4582DRAFT_2078895 [Lactarius indigo]
MVALVATALYATLYEWRTGEHQVSEFSQNAYMDVYQGHVNTFKHIQENREAGPSEILGCRHRLQLLISISTSLKNESPPWRFQHLIIESTPTSTVGIIFDLDCSSFGLVSSTRI